jgi:acyl-coenzyme A thioesterase 9
MDDSKDIPPSNNNNKNNNALRFVSHLKNPIVHQLWTARGHAKEKARLGNNVVDLTTPRVPSQSTTQISYPFSTDEFLKETYRNPWGQMRFGKILEDLDALAGNIAFAHVQDPNLNIVTASVDRIRLTSAPNLEGDQHLSGKVTYVGTSSMEIRMECTGSDGKEWMEAYFTFVATDPETKRPLRIPPLQPETPLEHEFFQAGQRRAALRKQARKEANASGGMFGAINPELQQTATELLKEAGPLLNMPSLANPHSILVSHTKLQNAEIAQPQVRNLANQIFGGFLMRRACELAYSTAYVFGGALPIFYEVDQVSFSMPVNVGDLINIHSRVLYTTVKEELPDFDDVFEKGQRNIPLVSVQVEAWIIDPVQASAQLSNQFFFTFALPAGTNIRKVLPGNMEEARVMATRMAADQAQEEEDR